MMRADWLRPWAANLVPQPSAPQAFPRPGGGWLAVDRPLIMGILNATPDSFSDGGAHPTPQDALAHAQSLVDAGADLLDLGGASTRPGAKMPTPQDEWARLAELAPALRERFPNLPLSIDTTWAYVAERALDAGFDVVNDVSAASWDPDLLPLIAQRNALWVAMHMQGTPATMQLAPRYRSVVDEVQAYLVSRLNAATRAGVHSVWVDPGFGFGKTLAHNYQLLHGLPQLAGLGVPLLVGLSRKSMVSRALGQPWAQTLPAATALHLAALQGGARILRVHDVEPARQAIRVWAWLQAAPHLPPNDEDAHAAVDQLWMP